MESPACRPPRSTPRAWHRSWRPPSQSREIIDPFEQLLDAVRKGADWAVAQLWRDLHPRLLAFFRATEPVAAEDLAADTWVDVARSLHRFEGDEVAFRRFAFTIARRRLIDHRRRRFRRRTDSVATEVLAEHAAADDTAAAALGAAALEVIGRLPADQAEIVLLRVVAGLDAGEVGRIVGKSAGAVRVAQHRALQRLAQLLGEDL
ncbi:MAG: polymerase sigma-70 factor, subfamily [Actinomycetota bacterium]